MVRLAVRLAVPEVLRPRRVVRVELVVGFLLVRRGRFGEPALG